MAENVLGTMAIRTRAESTVPQDLAPSIKSVRDFGQASATAGQSAATGLAQAGQAAEGAGQSTASLDAAQKRFLTTLERQSQRVTMTASEYAAWRAQQLGISNEAQPFVARMREAESATRGAGEASVAASSASERFVQSLRDQVETLGMNQRQLMEYRAAQLGVSDQAGPLISRLNDVDERLQRGGMSAAQTANAMRMLPAQFTDIATSIAGGMPLYLIAIQQGGQIRDSFGGVGASLRAIGSLITPTRLLFGTLAGAIGAVALAAYQGHSETGELQKALLSGGNAAGTTAERLSGLGQEVGRLTGRYGAAREAAMAVAQSGQISADALRPVMMALVSDAEMTGGEIEKLAEKYAKLADDPVKAIEALSKSHGNFTLAIYDQVRALVEQGDKQGAVALAQRSLADETLKHNERVRSSAGTLEKAWDGIRAAASWAWDAMLNVGRPAAAADLAAQAAAIEEQIARIEFGSSGFETTEGGAAVGGGRNSQVRAMANLRDSLADIYDEMNANAAAAIAEDVEQQARATEQRRIAARKELEAQAEDIQTQQDRREKAIKQAKLNAAEVGWTAEQLAAHIAKINEKYKDPKVSGGIKGPSENALAGVRAQIELERKRIVQLDETYEILLRGQGVVKKLTGGEKALLTVQEQLRVATSAGTKAKLEEQKALLQTQIAVEKERAAKEARNKGQEDFEKIREREEQASIREIDSITQKAIAIEEEIATYGRGKAAAEEMAIARLESRRAALMEMGASPELIATLTREIEARRRLSAAMGQKEGLDANKKASEEAARDWERVVDQVGQSLTDALFDGGKSGKELVEDMFRTMVLRPALEPIVRGGMNIIGQAMGIPGAAGVGGAPGTGATSFNWSNMLGGGSISSSVTQAADYLGYKLWESGFSESGNALASSAESLGSIANTAGQVIGYGKAIYDLTEGNYGSAIGTAVGTYILPGIGTMIGSMLGGMLDGAFAGETRTGAQYGLASNGQLYNPRRGTTVSSADGIQFLEGPSGGGANPAMQVAGQATVDAINQVFRTVGADVALDAFWFGYEGSEKGRGGVGAGGRLTSGAAFGETGQGDNYRGTLFDPTRPTSLSIEEALQLLPGQFNQVALQAWKSAADMFPPVLRTVLQGADLENMSDEALAALRTQVETFVQQADMLRAGLDGMPWVPASAKTFTFAAALAEAAGSADNAAQLVSSGYQNFWTEAQRVEHTTTRVTAGFAALGLELPRTREEMQALLQANMALGEGGAATVAALLAMGDDLSAVLASQEAVASERMGLEQRLLTLQGDTAALRQLELDKLSPSNRALQERIWLLEDEKTASDNAKAAAAEVKGLEDTFYDLVDPAGKLARQQRALAGEFDALGVAMPVALDDFADLVTGTKGMGEAHADTYKALLRLAPAFAQYIQGLDDQATATKASARAFAANQQMVRDSIANTIDGLRQTVALDQLGTPERQYGYYKAQIDSLTALLPSLTSADAINDTVSRITQLSSSAYGLLDDAGKASQGRDLLKFLDDLQERAIASVDKQQQATDERQAKIIAAEFEKSFDKVADRLVTEISRAARSGEQGMQLAAASIRSISNATIQSMGRLTRTRTTEVTA